MRSIPAMEKIIVSAHFHTAHRQPGFANHCRHFHGHTWRGRITVSTREFPRDELDVSLDFGALKKIMRDLDHKIVVTPGDRQFLESGIFEDAGVVMLDAKGPSVEAVAHHIWNGVAALIAATYPGRGIEYAIEVHLQETDNNVFVVEKTASV